VRESKSKHFLHITIWARLCTCRSDKNWRASQSRSSFLRMPANLPSEASSAGGKDIRRTWTCGGLNMKSWLVPEARPSATGRRNRRLRCTSSIQRSREEIPARIQRGQCLTTQQNLIRIFSFSDWTRDGRPSCADDGGPTSGPEEEVFQTARSFMGGQRSNASSEEHLSSASGGGPRQQSRETGASTRTNSGRFG
jgi:hypothetical protein